MAKNRAGEDRARDTTVTMDCGHDSSFSHTRPITGEIVFCIRCRNYRAVTKGREAKKSYKGQEEL